MVKIRAGNTKEAPVERKRNIIPIASSILNGETNLKSL